MSATAMTTTQALPSSHIADDEAALFAAHAPSLKPSFMRRLFDALVEAQMRRAQREVNRILGPRALERAVFDTLPPQR